MADIVQILPDHVVDQIAAGEVIERPASVVKELVENAIDAGARAISVDVEGGGRALIRVVDDGSGMTAADARRALERHATSKLRAVDDLWTLGTMGFRGEALPSIASVSRMTLSTRVRGDDVATRILVDAGRIVDVGATGAAPGTSVEVRELLHNVPARLKFLKGDATEAAHVTDVVQRLAMTHPAIHFTLRHNGRVALDAPASSALERARCLLGARLAERLHPAAGEEGGVQISAYLGAPDLAQSTARGVQLFVGRRWVRDRTLLHAVTMGYGELIPRGRYPVAVIRIDLPGDAVDVNVHPQKLEVRFADAAAVTAALRHVVRKGLASAPWLAETASSTPFRMDAVASMAPPVLRTRDLVDRYAETTTRQLFPLGLGTSRAADQRRLPVPVPVPVPVPDRGPGPVDFFSSLRYLGQLDRTYLICDGDGELVLIDQHAAHERVEFQRLRERTGPLAQQRLLFPTHVEASPAHLAAVTEAAELLAATGFEVEPFGVATVAIKAIPAGLRHDPASVLRELLDELADHGGSRAVDDRLDHVLATIACHSVVRAGDVLAPREAEALLASMDGVDFRAHCPHGRPVLLRIGVPEIARRFGR